MEFTDLMEDCTWITCSDSIGVWLLVAAIGLILAIVTVRSVARRRARVLLGLPRRENDDGQGGPDDGSG